jgi:hypothetical protein
VETAEGSAGASLEGPSGHRLLHHINSCKLCEEVARCMYIWGYICTVGPRPLCSNRQGGPPLHCWVRRECNCPRWLSGQYWSMLSYVFQHCRRDHWFPRKTLDSISSVSQKYYWFPINAFRKTSDSISEPEERPLILNSVCRKEPRYWTKLHKFLRPLIHNQLRQSDH